MFTAAELAEMHETYLDALPDTCTITNPVPAGGSADVTTGVRCGVLRPTRNTLDGSGYTPVNTRVDWTVTVPLGTVVKTGATIDVTFGDSGKGTKRLKAGQVVDPASYSHCPFVQCTEAA